MSETFGNPGSDILDTFHEVRARRDRVPLIYFPLRPRSPSSLGHRARRSLSTRHRRQFTTALKRNLKHGQPEGRPGLKITHNFEV